MSLHPNIERAFNEIDAAIFSGDQFENVEDLAKLRYHIERWERNTMNCGKCVYERTIGKCSGCKKAYEHFPNNFVLKELENEH